MKLGVCVCVEREEGQSKNWLEQRIATRTSQAVDGLRGWRLSLSSVGCEVLSSERERTEHPAWWQPARSGQDRRARLCHSEVSFAAFSDNVLAEATLYSLGNLPKQCFNMNSCCFLTLTDFFLPLLCQLFISPIWLGSQMLLCTRYALLSALWHNVVKCIYAYNWQIFLMDWTLLLL